MIPVDWTIPLTALLISFIALGLSIRQQRGPDIKVLSPHPAELKIARCDREPDMSPYHEPARAEVAVDLVVVNEGATTGTLMICEASLKQWPEPVSDKEWRLMLTREETGPDGIRNEVSLSERCPLPVQAGENFPARLTLTHEVPSETFQKGSYEQALRRSHIWIQIRYISTKKMFLIGPTRFHQDFCDIKVSKEEVSAALTAYFDALQRRKGAREARTPA